LAEYANIGLRTLVLAKKYIEKSDFEVWNGKYKQALSSLSNREEKVAALQDEIESNMTLIAATAIEDKLQDEVGNTVKK
jgi:magnesium-transporting ATPase (P-type)